MEWLLKFPLGRFDNDKGKDEFCFYLLITESKPSSKSPYYLDLKATQQNMTSAVRLKAIQFSHLTESGNQEISSNSERVNSHLKFYFKQHFVFELIALGLKFYSRRGTKAQKHEENHIKLLKTR